jgi:endonuclease/exonuclease/phosphatase family metal-dependent hydrolase
MKVFDWSNKPTILWIVIAFLLAGMVSLSLERHMYPAKSGAEINNQPALVKTEKSSIRVSTYNIHRATGENGQFGSVIEDIAEVLKNDDISALQEVLGESLFGTASQAELLADLTDSGWLFAPTQTRFNRVYTGNGLLSRIPVTRWEITPLIWSQGLTEDDQSKRHRNLITAEITLNGQQVMVFVTHFDRGEIRQSQLESVFREFEQHDNAILLGDFNIRPSEFDIESRIRSSKSSDMISLITAENDKPYRVDWILTRGFKLIDGGLNSSELSDHPYYWAEIELLD